jgi:hypothetical protein
MKTFNTTDWPLVNTLFCLGFKIDYLDRHDPQRIEFCFIREQGLDEAVQSFWRGEISLPVQQIFASQKLLKSRMNSHS